MVKVSARCVCHDGSTTTKPAADSPIQESKRGREMHLQLLCTSTNESMIAWQTADGMDRCEWMKVHLRRRERITW